MSEHARLSLSQGDTWIVCAAWARKVDGMGDEHHSGRRFGDISREILSDMLLVEEPAKGLAHEDETEAAKMAYDYIQDRWAVMSSVEHTNCFVEGRVDIKASGRTDLWGTPEAVLYNSKMLEIICLETGQGTFVNEHTAAKLKLYAIAAMETYELTPDEVKLTIVQPRFWGDVEKIRTLDILPAALISWFCIAVTPAATRSDVPDAQGTASINCKKCAGRHICEYRDHAVGNALVGGTLENIQVNTTMDVNERDIRKAQDAVIYDNPRLGDLLLLVPVIRDYCDALEEHARDIILAGEQVPNFKVVAVPGVPKWVGDMEDLHAKLNKSTLKKEDYMKYKLKTPGQVMQLKSGPKKDKPISKAMTKVIADHTGRTEGGHKLVLESDPRESIRPAFPTAQEMQEQTPATTSTADIPAFLL